MNTKKNEKNISSYDFQALIKYTLRVYFCELGNKNYDGCKEILEIMEILMANMDKIIYPDPNLGDHLFPSASREISKPVALRISYTEHLILIAKELSDSIIARNETEKPRIFFSESMKLLPENGQELSLATIFLQAEESRSLPPDIMNAIRSFSVKKMYSLIERFPWIHRNIKLHKTLA